MKPFIYPYKMQSVSATKLAKKLGTKKIYPDRKYAPKSKHLVINWGMSTSPIWIEKAEQSGTNIFNHPNAVNIASNKLTTFIKLKEFGVNIPNFTTDVNKAIEWIMNGTSLIARTKLKGTQGDGCYFLSSDKEEPHPISIHDPNIKLFSEYVKKTAEFRVHIFNGQVIDFIQKKQKKDFEDVDFKIRNHNNGWVFCREGVELPEEVVVQAIRSLEALQLDFGAVDVIWNKYKGAYILEINTAPGLEGSTIDKYTQAIEEVCNHA